MPSFEHRGGAYLLRGIRPGLSDPDLRSGRSRLRDRRLEPALGADQPDHRVRYELSCHRDDQRNAGGKSRAPVAATDNWDTYTADHIALLDHLRIDRCHLYGQCIGGSFIMNMIKAQPERVSSAVLAQPIGRVAPALPPKTARFNAWVESLTDHPEATTQVLDAFYRNLYEAGFVYCTDRAFARA